MQVSDDVLAQISDLYHQGRYLAAYELSREVGPLQAWESAEARILAGRLASNLGSQRLGRALHARAFREAPENQKVRYFYVLSSLPRRGPWKTLRLIDELGEPPADDSPARADWLAAKAHVLALLRDFSQADRCIDQALELAPNRPWLWVEQSSIRECEDRHEDSLVAAEKAFALQPWYRPAVQQKAYRLVQLNRDAEALALLEEAATRIESGDVVGQLATLQTEIGQYAEARENYARIATLHPLLHLDRGRQKWLAARRADAAYYCGDMAEAIEFAKQADVPFYMRLAERLTASPDGKRVQLPVKFVLQHHSTCSPATLSAICDYWKVGTAHLEIAEKICYDGTPTHSERRWAEENGFVAREFRVTWDSAVALLDRGIPFTLTTIDPGNAHLQAAIGYDSPRGTMLVRDPSERHFGEFAAEEMLKHYEATGPRGMAMVPRVVDGPGDPSYADLDLPDATLYDLYYQLELALERHDRAAAQSLHDQMCTADPQHRLTLRARGNLANYDSDIPALLANTEQLLALNPQDANLVMAKLNCLFELGRRDERLALLQETCQRPDCDPLFWTRYAQELVEDARQHDHAAYLLRRAIRYRPADARSYSLLAELYWDQQRHDEALQLYRIATCLDDKNEAYAKMYFQAARCRRQTDAALRFLTDRFERFGAKSGWPARTLCWAHEQMDQTNLAFDLVERALSLRPTDDELRLFAADLYGRFGRPDRATTLLEAARAGTHPTNWLRSAASLASYRGDLPAALGFWRQVLEADPLARDTHEQVAALLADTESLDAAREHLRQTVERFPRNLALRTLYIEWLREDSAATEAALRELIAQHPDDAWSQRELAIAMSYQGKWDEALAVTEYAQQLEPSSPIVHTIRGRILQAHGRRAEAKAAFREALRLAVDYELAIASLIDVCESKAEREAELRFVCDELKRQVILGDGLLRWRDYAEMTLEPESLLAELRVALGERPDLWHAWSAVVRQLVTMQRFDEARQLALQAVERFPLLPRMWLDLAAVGSACGDTAGEVEALEHALAINPAWGEAARHLAEVHESRGDFERAKAVYESAIQREPREAQNHASLATVLWRLGDREAAVERLVHAVRLEPGYEEAWGRLQAWCSELGRPERAVEEARELTRTRPREARSWLVLADMLNQPEQRAEAYAALDRAQELNPRGTQSFNLRAFYLAADARYDEAFAACQPPVFGDEIPLELRARAAYVTFARGELPEAVERMQAVVAADADYFWAWHRLAEWTEQLGRRDECLEASRQMVRIMPQNAVAWGFLGDAERQNDHRDAAKAAFQRAFELAPEYTFGAMAWFDLQLEDGEFDAAEKTLAATAPHSPPDFVTAARVRLACHRRNRDEALRWLRELCVTPSDGPGALDIAIGACWEAEWGADATAVLAEQMSREQTIPAVGEIWVKSQSALGSHTECADQLDRLPVNDRWLSAARELLDQCRGQNDRRTLNRFVQRHRDTLVAHTTIWTQTAFAYADLPDPRAVQSWLRGWETRSDVSALALLPLTISHWDLREYSAAEAVSRQAMELPADSSWASHAFWCAAFHRLFGEEQQATELVAELERLSLSPYYQDLFALLRSTTRTDLDSARVNADAGHRDRRFRRLYWLCRRRLADRSGRLLDSLWSRLREHVA